MKLSFSTLGCPSWTLRQIAENAASMGYDGVDFRGLRGEMDITQCREFTIGLRETQRLFADNGVTISGLLTGAHYAVADAAAMQKQFDETLRYLELAPKLGGPFLRVFGGRPPDGYTVEAILPFLADNLRRMGEEARQHNVILALETHDEWTDSEVCARVMQRTAHPNVRVLWDLHHPYRTRGEVPDHTYRNLAPYVVNLHVKDSLPTPEGGHTLVLVGEGDVPLKTMLDALAAGGYEGYACLEWEKRWHPTLPEPEIAFPHYIRQMRRWLEE